MSNTVYREGFWVDASKTSLNLLNRLELDSDLPVLDVTEDIGDTLGIIMMFLELCNINALKIFAEQVPDGMSINQFVDEKPEEAIWFLDHVAHEIMHAIAPVGFTWGKREGEFGFWKNTESYNFEDRSLLVDISQIA